MQGESIFWGPFLLLVACSSCNIMEKESLFQENEIVIMEAKKHIFVYLEDVLIHSFGCVVFITAGLFLSERGGQTEGIVSLFLYMFVLIFFTSFFYAWTKNYFDAWYITNVHIVAVNQRGILDREVSYMEYSRIQDVFFEKEGLVQTFFGFGRLKVQTAGAEQEFIIDSVRDVENIAKKILELRDIAQK